MDHVMMGGIVVALASLLGACATSSPPRPGDSELFAVTRQDGKGTPNGRSDSADPFTALDQVATDAGYGHTAADPVRLGGIADGEGAQRERLFLNGLRGPGDEPLAYERLGSCCPFETPLGFDGWGLLDKFELRVDGQAEPIHLYLDIYREAAVRVPVGLLPRRGAR